MTWFETLRKSAATGIWSQGVRAARVPSAVVVEGRTADEVVARVRPVGDAGAPTVTLYLTDEEWTCDCGSPVDPCVHVVTVAVAVHQGVAETVAALPPSPREATATAAPRTEQATEGRRRLGYLLQSDPQGLTLSRTLVAPDGTSTPLRASLNHPGARTLVRELMLRDQDLTLDRLIGSALGRYRVGPTQAAVLAALDGAPNVQLDGQAIAVLTDPLLPVVHVVDVHDGVAVEINRPQEFNCAVGTGLGLAASVLRPLGETELSGLRWDKLPNVRQYRSHQYGELVTRVLPQLQKRMEVNIDTQRLPGLTRRVPPSVAFDIRTEGDTLVVVAHIVYGTPALARVEHNQLVQFGTSAPRRDLAAETTLMHQLREELDLLVERPFHLQGIDAARFSQRLQSWQRQHATASEQIIAQTNVELVPEVSYVDDKLCVDFVTQTPGELTKAPADVVLRAFEEGFEQIPLSNGQWGALPKAWLHTNGAWLGDILSMQNRNLELTPAARVSLVQFCLDTNRALPSTLMPYAALLNDGIPEAVLPQDFCAELRSYQRLGTNWLSAIKSANLGAILADDMGLGKTIQALGVVAGRALVVCPRSVMHNWINEAGRFRPALPTNVYHGPNRQLRDGDALAVTTYALLRQDIELLKQVHFDTVILDEAQAIKNCTSQVAQAAYALNADFRLVLTGTPIENRLEELFSLMHFANPGLLGSPSRFKARFSEPIALGNTAAAQRLRRLLSPFLMRRKRDDVLDDLPPRTDAVIWVELEESERQVYEHLAHLARSLAAHAAAGQSRYFAALEALLRLRQAACHLGLLPDRNEIGSSKIDCLVDMLEEVIDEGHRALVFSQWTSLLSKIEPALSARSIEFSRLDGQTRDRQSVVNQFQSSSGPPVLLASLQAGGTGLNLTGADHVFLIDPWWNPAVEDQATSRAHRMGQTRPVCVYRLVAKDTVEERILMLQQRKRNLGTLLDDAQPEAALSQQELLDLIR